MYELDSEEPIGTSDFDVSLEAGDTIFRVEFEVV